MVPRLVSCWKTSKSGALIKESLISRRRKIHAGLRFIKASQDQSAFKAISRDHSIPIERHHAPEIRVQDTGDHAVEWSIYYYTKETRKVLGTRQAIIETILKTSKTFNISLATPLTHQMDVAESPMQQPPPNFTVGNRQVSYGRNFSIPVFAD